MKNIYHPCYRIFSGSLLLLLWLIAASTAYGQTSAFTYQGRLTDSDNPADGVFDMQFKLFNTATVGTGTQQGSTITNSTVEVENGVFSVQLDFAPCASCFDGSARFLEIGIRPAGSLDPYTVLSPRQPIASTPYAVRALDASQLGGIAASGFIQNTTTQQIMTNFNIGGNGTLGGTLSANSVNATTQYNIGNFRVLSAAGAGNLFVGVGSGTNNMGGTNNSFFGNSAGTANQTGSFNSFFGTSAGVSNTASNNSFFGASAGDSNTSGTNNSFFGRFAGQANLVGSGNAFFGANAGMLNTASDNSFFGSNAGDANTSGDGNAFFGSNAGGANQTGNNNSFFGNSAGLLNTSSNNSFFGAFAGDANTSGSSNTFFGTNAGSSNQTGGSNAFFGRDAGFLNTATGNSFFGDSAGSSNTNGINNAFFGRSAGALNTASDNSFFGSNAGDANTSGDGNAFFGSNAGGANQTGNNNSFFGNSAGLLNTSSNNSFFGAFAGDANTTGDDNSFFGTSAGGANQTGSTNSFFGRSAGVANTSGNNNSFFGNSAGLSNISGNNNSFFGQGAGRVNTASDNSFFGLGTGDANTSGGGNAFFGSNAGSINQTGANNAFFGNLAGIANVNGSFITIIGTSADVGVDNLTNATAIGARAQVDQSDSLVLGSTNGVNGATATVKVGIGTTTPADRLHVNGIIRVDTLGAAGGTELCRNGAFQISTCSSSLRYKDHLAPFTAGLELINGLRPITFNWKQTGERDLGLAAEEVAEVEPLLVTYNERGQVEGVKYDRINIALINAVRQQQQQIADKDEQIKLLQRQNAAFEARLRALEGKLAADKTAHKRSRQIKKP